MAITEHQSIWRSTPVHGEQTVPFVSGNRRSDSDDDTLAYEPRWGRWKVTLIVVLFCAAFWSGVAYIATRLLG